MSYKALYRIYRPIDFNEVAGQTHITTTLKNALVNDQVAHAYLFSGPRGTGKTSIAKIFAKAINCVKAPVENPCNECENCIGIQNGTISDVIEIDAASNNGVDEIREIRDKVKYLPGYVKYKVYIIDEVHMLSTGAFNALLKTLEEPPQHVIFILCTTEPQKIPLTIHSRCQRFDFKAITTTDIITKLKEITSLEKIIVDDEALNQIAILAEGGLRDAISMLDQARSYSPKHITIDDVNQISGSVSMSMQLELAEALIEGNSSNSIEILNNLITEGKEVRKININLIEFFRDILMFRNIKTLDESNYLFRNENFVRLANDVNNNVIFYILDILNKAANDIKWSSSPKIYLELAFIKITDSEVGSRTKLLSAIDNLEIRISELEKIKDDIDKIEDEKSKIIISEIVNQTEKPIEKEYYKAEIVKKIEEKEDTISESEKSITIEVENETILNNEEKNIEEIVELNDEKEINNNINSIDETYSIDFVEKVLNNGDVNDKRYLINSWDSIKKSVSNEEEKYVAQLLGLGSISASSKNKIIITFPSVSFCNKIMSPNNKIIAKEVLKKHYNREIDIIALPEDVFKDITIEFIGLWKKDKTKYIRLTKIECEGLENVAKKEEIVENHTQPKVVTDALDIFGDIVKIKK